MAEGDLPMEVDAEDKTEVHELVVEMKLPERLYDSEKVIAKHQVESE